MSAKMARIMLVAMLLVTAVLAGCGGGKSESAGGRVQVVIAWPDRDTPPSRYIPPYAASIHLELHKQDAPDVRFALTVNRPNDRPSTQTISFNGLVPIGQYTLAGVARVERDGQGPTVASAATPVEVKPNQTFTANLTLGSTIRTIEILGQPLSVPVGARQTLVGRAIDPDGQVILLPINALKWSIVSGGSFATLTAEGEFGATAAGTVRVRLSEEGAGISHEADIEVVAGGVASGLANSSWPRFRADARNTAYGGGPTGTGQKLWEFQVTGGVPFPSIPYAPAIGTDGTLYFQATDGKMYAVDGATGAKKWEFTTGAPGDFADGPPVVTSNGIVYVASLSADLSASRLFALDAANGSKIWERPVGGGHIAAGTDGTRYVDGPPGSNALLALDGATGSEKWRTSEPRGTQGRAIGPDGTLYMGDGQVTAINGATGELKWRTVFSVFAGLYPTLLADGTLVVPNAKVPIGGTLYGLSSSTGARLWEKALPARPSNVAADPAGNIYLSAGRQILVLRGSDGSTVREWALPYNPETDPVLASDGTLYITMANVFVAFDSTTGAEKWRLTLTADERGSAAAVGADGTVYLVTKNSGRVYAIK
jgi:eukaryotic-like serine/threonine-protein kinase